MKTPPQWCLAQVEEEDGDEDWDALAESVARDFERFDHLCRNVPSCEPCGSDQVQLMDRTAPASWRCRMCKHRFQYEP